MRRAVCIVSPGNLASNPRVLKEADALHSAGYDVTAVVCNYNEVLRQADDEIEAVVPWKVIRVSRSRGEGIRARAVAQLAQILSTLGVPIPVKMAALSARTPVDALMRRAPEVPADLYIAHYVAALPAAAAAARRHGALLGFDAEDFHSGEGTGAPGDAFRMKMIEIVERSVLPSCAHMTAAAPLIWRGLPGDGVERLPAVDGAARPEAPSDRGGRAWSAGILVLADDRTRSRSAGLHPGDGARDHAGDARHQREQPVGAW